MTARVELEVDPGARYDLSLGDAWVAVDLDDPRLEDRLAELIGAARPVSTDEDAVQALETLATVAALLRAATDRLPDPAQRFVAIDGSRPEAPPTVMVLGVAVAGTDVPDPQTVADTWWSSFDQDTAVDMAVDRLDGPGVVAVVLRERDPDPADWGDHLAVAAVWPDGGAPMFFDASASGPFAHLVPEVVEQAATSVHLLTTAGEGPAPTTTPAEDAR